MARYSHSGITLREIVLLIALAAMLGFAIAPYFQAEEKKAAGVASMNNLMQWGIGLNLYLMDHNNRLPEVGPVEPDAALKEAWYNALPPYLSQAPWGRLMAPGFDPRSSQAIIWSDPAFRKFFPQTAGIFLFPYAMNRWLQPDPMQGSYQIFDVADPRTTVFLGESASTSPGLLPETVSYRYSNHAAHVLFVDGHAALVGKEELETENKTAFWRPFEGSLAPTDKR